jgi:hypothetical protein
MALFSREPDGSPLHRAGGASPCRKRWAHGRRPRPSARGEPPDDQAGHLGAPAGGLPGLGASGKARRLCRRRVGDLAAGELHRSRSRRSGGGARLPPRRTVLSKRACRLGKGPIGHGRSRPGSRPRPRRSGMGGPRDGGPAARAEHLGRDRAGAHRATSSRAGLSGPRRDHHRSPRRPAATRQKGPVVSRRHLQRALGDSMVSHRSGRTGTRNHRDVRERRHHNGRRPTSDRRGTRGLDRVAFPARIAAEERFSNRVLGLRRASLLEPVTVPHDGPSLQLGHVPPCTGGRRRGDQK